jgi:hypothetical protein
LKHQHGIDYVATRKGKYTTKCPSCGGGYLNVQEKREATKIIALRDRPLPLV